MHKALRWMVGLGLITLGVSSLDKFACQPPQPEASLALQPAASQEPWPFPIPTPPPPLPTGYPTPTPIPRQLHLTVATPAFLAKAAVSAFTYALAHSHQPMDGQSVVVLDPQGQIVASFQADQSVSADAVAPLLISWAAINTWGLDHRFETKVYRTGTVSQGVLQGDLWVEGEDNPILTGEMTAELAQRLRNLGILSVAGSLKMAGSLTLQQPTQPSQSGIELDGLMFKTLETVGSVPLPPNAEPLFHFQSPPLSANLKAEHSVNCSDCRAGGGLSRALAYALPNQIDGLAVTSVLQDIKAQVGTLSTVFPEAGVGENPLSQRQIPLGSVAFSHSHPHPSRGGESVAASWVGVLPNGMMVVLLNEGNDLAGILALQDRFLQDLSAITP